MNVRAIQYTDVVQDRHASSYGFALQDNFQFLSYGKFEHLWSYGGKLALLARNLLNAMANTPYMLCLAGVNSVDSIKATVTHIKLLSIVSVPFSVFDIKELVQKIAKGISINDQEGAALSSLSLTITAADAVDSVSTFINSALTVSARSSIGLLSNIGLPLGLGISSAGTLSRSILIFKTFSLYQKIHVSNFLEEKYMNKMLFKHEVEEALGIFAEQRLIELLSFGPMSQDIIDRVQRLKEKKQSIILRSIPNEAQKEIKMIFNLLDDKKSEFFTDREFETVLDGIRSIQSHLEKKVSIAVLGALANLIVIFALVLFSIGTVGAKPFMLMATAFVIRLMSLIYQDQKLHITAS